MPVQVSGGVSVGYACWVVGSSIGERRERNGYGYRLLIGSLLLLSGLCSNRKTLDVARLVSGSVVVEGKFVGR